MLLLLSIGNEGMDHARGDEQQQDYQYDDAELEVDVVFEVHNENVDKLGVWIFLKNVFLEKSMKLVFCSFIFCSSVSSSVCSLEFVLLCCSFVF